MFNPLKSLYRQYGKETDDLIYYLLSYDDVISRFKFNTPEYNYCMNELREILLEDHDESFLDTCLSFYRQCYNNEKIMSAIEKHDFEMMDVDKVMDSYINSSNKTIEETLEDVEVQSIEKSIEKPLNRVYKYPPLSLLKSEKCNTDCSKDFLCTQAKKIEKVLSNNNILAQVIEVQIGPRAVLYTLGFDDIVPVSSIKGLKPDFMLALAAKDVEFMIPIPGTNNIGIKVSLDNPSIVFLKDSIEAEKGNLVFPIGKDDVGNKVVVNFNDVDNLLIAGTTGSGKSELIDTIITSILMNMSPASVKLLLIDTHMIQLQIYNGAPHLLLPVVTDARKAVGAIHWLIKEATDRLEKFALLGVKDITSYNQKIDNGELIDYAGNALQKFASIFCIVDDYTDIVMQDPSAEEEFAMLCRIARIAGIHLICAIQRPTANVINTAVKTNFKTRICFQVTSAIESRIVLDDTGAEDIHDHGVFLYHVEGVRGLQKAQSIYVSEEEIQNVVNYLESQNEIESALFIEQKSTKLVDEDTLSARDSLFAEAGRLIIENQKGSIGYIQRNFRIGFNRAARIMDQLEEAGVVGPELGTKPREVCMSIAEFELYIEN